MPPLHYPFSLLWIAAFFVLLFSIVTGVLRGAPRYSIGLFWSAIGAAFAAQALDGF
ncbi:hypothetical protein ABIF65_005726 [Bradyrhizobium japonicum]|jgi:hypothetical protein|uniref:hypothetical protein n=1 Tax=Bradyrhizobium TaxID=374 RepID=UPI0004144FD8|nr:MULTISPECIES: hypothetical protein [Bradyrhizobium]MBR0764798.1 hypothetical protein [Bradyrhizobium japonicum]MBR0884048.1 hypothetical protein [Bradyrhizobium liaoningense]MBR0948203.1 hypothetical protein [Bradyrhizobium liaoningense]MBR1005097.1 hypothetical protein [Bradyrhizobium liaoningense]MBR1033919.1 hypothetical protein [Bradyrhizobium liaoningense]